MKKALVLLLLLTLFVNCRSVKKEDSKKEIHYELVTTLRDSLVITHEKKETVTEKTVERLEDKKEKADNYKRTDKDGTVHEYNNYNTEIKTDEKTIESVRELVEKYTHLETKFNELQEKYDVLEKDSKKEREFDFISLIWICVGFIVFAAIGYFLYKLQKTYRFKFW